MMLALLIDCYANGLFSSQRIERATHRDVAVRYLTGGRHPDHDTICTFRRENSEAFGEAFLEVLQLAREAGLLKVGTVSVDGSKIKANASKHKALTYERACELDRQLELEIAELMQNAEERPRATQKGPPGRSSARIAGRPAPRCSRHSSRSTAVLARSRPSPTAC